MPRIRLRAPYSHIVFRKRSTALIVQPTKIKQTSDDYYYSCLLLFFPHRTEGNLIIPFCTYRTFFSANFQNLDKSYESIHSISCELEEAVRRIHLINAHEEIYNDVYDQANGTNQMSNYSIYEQGENNVEVPNNINLHSDEREFNVSDELTWHFSLPLTKVGIHFGHVRMYATPYPISLIIFILDLGLSYTDKLLEFRWVQIAHLS